MRRVNIAVLVGFWQLTMPGQAEDAAPLVDADLISELGLARLADEVGDQHLAAWLGGERRDLQLSALRAAVYADAPERLVGVMASTLCGRDPTLAFEASLTFGKLAERLTPSELAQREVLRADLDAARAALRCAQDEHATVRADFAMSALLLDAALAQP